MKMKLKFFNGTVIPVLLYDSVAWKGLKEVETKLRVFESNCLRKVMSIKWFEHVTEEEVRKRNGQQSVIQTLKTERWRYYGHMLRMNEEKLPKQVLIWRTEGSRRQGRPKDT